MDTVLSGIRSTGNLHLGNYFGMGVHKKIFVLTGFLLLSLSAMAAPFTFTVETDSITCYGDSDGSAWVTNIVGGTAPFTYKWYTSGWTLIPGETNDTITGLGYGDYIAWVEDDDGTPDFMPFSIKEPSSIFILSVTPTDVTCNGLDDGSISIVALGGTSPLKYSITGGAPYQASSTFDPLPPGDYNVAVEDYNGCGQTWASINLMYWL